MKPTLVYPITQDFRSLLPISIPLWLLLSFPFMGFFEKNISKEEYMKEIKVQFDYVDRHGRTYRNKWLTVSDKNAHFYACKN